MLISEHTKRESLLATYWSKVILIIHTYNFFTTFYFLGIVGFPEGVWLIIEAFSEIIIVFDFLLRLVIRLKFPIIWEHMWLLHDKGSVSKFHFILRLIGSIPQTLILCIIFKSNMAALNHF